MARNYYQQIPSYGTAEDAYDPSADDNNHQGHDEEGTADRRQRRKSSKHPAADWSSTLNEPAPGEGTSGIYRIQFH